MWPTQVRYSLVLKETHEMNRVINVKLNIASWIFVVMAFILAVQGVIDGLPMHGFDQSWPDHARFHITWATASKVGFCITVGMIALIPFRKAERWSWWALLVFTVFGNISLLPAAIWQGSGPRAGFEIPIVIGLIALLAGLVLSFRVGFPSREVT
jgi:hypothetical protein